MHPRFKDRLKSLDRAASTVNDGVDNGGGPPHDGDMEARVAKLESDLSVIKTDVAVIRSSLDDFASKADLHKEINAQTWKLVTFVTGFGTALVAAVYFIATHTK